MSGSQSDDQNTESLSEVTADETSSIPVLEGFEPIETEDEQYSLMTKILLCNALKSQNGPLSYRILLRKLI